MHQFDKPPKAPAASPAPPAINPIYVALQSTLFNAASSSRKRQAAFVFTMPVKTSHFLSNANNGFSRPICRSLPRLNQRKQRAYVPTTYMAVGQSSTKTLSEGLILEFQGTSGERILGVADKPNGKRNWIVRDFRNTAHSITPKQVVYILGTPATAGLECEISQLKRTCEDKLQDSDECLQVAWELLQTDCDDLKNIELQLIADIAFGATDAVTLYATHVLLSKDSIFFKEKNIKGKIVYESRSQQLVDAAIKHKEAERVRKRQYLDRRNAIVSSVQNKSISDFKAILGKDVANMVLEVLKEMALDADNNPFSDNRFVSSYDNVFARLSASDKNNVKEVFESLGLQILPTVALSILTKLGVFAEHENLALYKADLIRNSTFGDTLKALADDLIANPPDDIDAERRRDLRHIRTYAIDSADTSEVDDAISWDAEASRVMVHIADPTRYFPDVEHPILREAMRRVATLYLPTHKLTMFPAQLATGIFSLDGHKSDGAALTIAFAINDDGSLQEDSISIETSYISPPIRITYEEAEKVLSTADDGEYDDLRALYEIAEKRVYWREMEGGAIIINTDFADIRVTKNESSECQVVLGVTKTNTKAWLVVSELMITACNITGIIANKEEIVVPFRGQEPFDYPDDAVLQSVADGPLRASLAFQNATTSEIRTEAMVHASLGLDEYVQMTSPIRRSADLIGHLQMKAHLRKEDCPLDKEYVEKEIGRISDIGRVLRKVETRTKKYWQHEFLRQNGTDCVYTGMYIRQLRDKEGLGFVYLEEYGFQIVANVPVGTKPGTMLNVKMSSVNPRSAMIRAEATHALTETGKSQDLSFDEVLSDVSDLSIE